MRMTKVYSLCGFDLHVDVITPAADKTCVWIFYLHGGGMLYGVRDDLPNMYVDMLEDAGCTLWCPDYPLAPETALGEISETIDALWECFCAEARAAGAVKLFAFGRSVGAYLVLALAKRLRSTKGRIPNGIASFYGYYDLEDPFFTEPSKYYRSYPTVDEKVARAFVRMAPPVYEPITARFALYVYARQTGEWKRLLGVNMDEVRALSLSDEDISQLPSLFLAASTGDEDVPYACSKRLEQKASDAHLMTVYYREHDFDRDTSCRVGADVYREMIRWMAVL